MFKLGYVISEEVYKKMQEMAKENSPILELKLKKYKKNDQELLDKMLDIFESDEFSFDEEEHDSIT